MECWSLVHGNSPATQCLGLVQLEQKVSDAAGTKDWLGLIDLFLWSQNHLGEICESQFKCICFHFLQICLLNGHWIADEIH